LNKYLPEIHYIGTDDMSILIYQIPWFKLEVVDITKNRAKKKHKTLLQRGDSVLSTIKTLHETRSKCNFSCDL